jgi:cyclopropane fatty-acyl-phospholipid synthase-like methyltransferase
MFHDSAMVTPKIEKPDAPSCARNREPILDVLQAHFADRTSVLEIGSGTGQHAIFFASGMPHLTWQASDRAECLPGIQAWLDEAALPNTPAPILLDVNGAWPTTRFDGVFSSNILHIMSWHEVERMFACLPGIMAANFKLVVYGPFNYGGLFTSESNAAFNAWLKQKGNHQGIRDFEAVDALAGHAGLVLIEDRPMPSNNRCLIWGR